MVGFWIVVAIAVVAGLTYWLTDLSGTDSIVVGAIIGMVVILVLALIVLGVVCIIY